MGGWLNLDFSQGKKRIFANLFVFLNISDFISIFKPQWRLKTSMEVYYTGVLELRGHKHVGFL